MKNHFLLLFIFATIPAFAKCPNSGEIVSNDALLRMENYWVQALVDRSSSELNCLLAPEFTDINWRGDALTREQVLQNAANRAPIPVETKHVFVDLKARIFGHIGIVTGLSYWLDSTGAKQNAARFTDVFLYRDGKWQAVSGQETVAQNP